MGDRPNANVIKSCKNKSKVLPLSKRIQGKKRCSEKPPSEQPAHRLPRGRDYAPPYSLWLHLPVTSPYSPKSLRKACPASKDPICSLQAFPMFNI